MTTVQSGAKKHRWERLLCAMVLFLTCVSITSCAFALYAQNQSPYPLAIAVFVGFLSLIPLARWYRAL